MTDEIDDDAFAEAFDRREADRIMSGIGLIIARHEPDPERDRVAALIARDKRDRAREMDRKQADMEMAKGVFVNLSDAVVEPTPEWLAMGETKTYFPRQFDETTRVVKTVRRVVTPITTRMLRAGKITDEQGAACDWYRDCYEAAGLDGRYKTSSFGEAGGGCTGMTCAPMAMHEREVQARQEFRAARASIAAHLLAMFDAVVLRDLPIHRAARLIRCSNTRIYPMFRMACNNLVVWCQGSKIEMVRQDA